MDIRQMIERLRAEKEEIERAIEDLEQKANLPPLQVEPLQLRRALWHGGDRRDGEPA